MTHLISKIKEFCKVEKMHGTCCNNKEICKVHELSSFVKYTKDEQGIIYSSIDRIPSFDYDDGVLFIRKIHYAPLAEEIVGKQEYENYKNIYDFLDNLDLCRTFKENVCYQTMNMPFKLKLIINSYASNLKCQDTVSDKSLYFSWGNYFVFNQYADMYSQLGCGNAFWHEIAHSISNMLQNDNVICAMSIKTLTWSAQNDFHHYKMNIMKSKSVTSERAEQIITDELRNLHNQADIVSDIYGGVTKNTVVGAWMHDDEYWHKTDTDETIIGEEFFAEVIANMICHNDDNIAIAEKYLKTTMLQFYTIMEGIYTYDKR